MRISLPSLKSVAVTSALALAVSVGLPAGIDGAADFLAGPAYAEEHGGGGHGGGGHGGGGCRGGGGGCGGGGHGGGGHGGGGRGQGPNPNCPFKDGSGRGGFGPGSAERHGGGHGGGGHGGGGHGATPGHADSSVASRDTGISGGGGGGENFVCDAPGDWHVGTKVFR